MQATTKMAVGLAALVALASAGVVGVSASGEATARGWSRVAEMHNREPGSSFSDAQLEGARQRLEGAVSEVRNESGGGDGPGTIVVPTFGDSCSVDCGKGCGRCQASASCDKPACSCSCSCKSAGTCTDCGWCGCAWCDEKRKDYSCSASCSGVGGSATVARNVTLDGEARFSKQAFQSWTAQEDGNASMVLEGIVTVASKDLAGRQVAGTSLEPALSTWADLVIEYHDWVRSSGPQIN